jgi:glycolate oxidase FAD binding subunit
MIIHVHDKETIVAAATQHPSLALKGGGSKTALAADAPVLLDLSALRGVLEYEPNEFTFTALAGTPIRELNALLAQHGQYLPFDPLLVDKGATLGGTVAANSSGPGRYRYGGVRDFILGVQFVDGQGQLVRGGGKVVKNSAGFDLPKLMVGSLGQLGILVELTFKVFPQPPAYATLKAELPDLNTALGTIIRLFSSPLELDALDLTPPGTLWLRQGGIEGALRPRLDQLRQFVGGGDILTGDDEATIWHTVSELAWVPAQTTLVKVPLTPKRIPALHIAIAPYEPAIRYSAGGNVAWIAWPASLDLLDNILKKQGLRGLTLLGEPTPQPLLGVPPDAIFARRIQQALDPQQRFARTVG